MSSNPFGSWSNDIAARKPAQLDRTAILEADGRIWEAGNETSDGESSNRPVVAAERRVGGIAGCLQVFVSHSHQDEAFCRAIAKGLRDAGADVWHAKHHGQTGRLDATGEREIRRRPVFVVLLSPGALRS